MTGGIMLIVAGIVLLLGIGYLLVAIIKPDRF